ITMGKEKKIQVRRVFGYFWGMSFLVVHIIGADIFAADILLRECGAFPVYVGWPCALLSIMTTLCSAEIGITFPCSGAHYYFLKKGYGNLISFLNLWTALFLGSGLAASQALLLAEYSIQPFYLSCSAPKLPKRCLALAILWTVGILNCRGVREVTWLQIASTVLKMAILGLISLNEVVLLVREWNENVEIFQNSFDAEFPEASQFIEATFQGYFANSGGGCFTYIAGELKEHRKTIPRCIFIASPLVSIVYLLVNISYLTSDTQGNSLFRFVYAVAITWTDRVIPSLTWIVPFGISASLFSKLLINGQLPLLFNMLNIYSSPFMSILLLATMASIAIVLTNLIDLINYIYFAVSIWTIFSLTGILKLRYQEPHLPRPYKVFLPFPLVAIAISLCLILIPLVKSQHMHYVYMYLCVFSGLLFYIPLIHFKLRLIWFEKMTCYLPLIFNICIPDVSDEQMIEEVETIKKNSILKA
uniref:Solute carrier family 7 member 13 n=1 Tax=Sus scrofa TaxID=9823 RepID=A0A8D1G9H7_PIG